MVQGVTAIVIVTSAVWLLNLSMRQTQGMVNDVEVVSFALITLVGLLIIGTRLWRLRKSHLTATATITITIKAHTLIIRMGLPLMILTQRLAAHFHRALFQSASGPCSGAVIVLLLAYSLNLLGGWGVCGAGNVSSVQRLQLPCSLYCRFISERRLGGF